MINEISKKFIKHSTDAKYTYRFDWLGTPIIQYPQDMIAVQEIIWKTKPNYIIETGVAHGGSILFYASLLHTLDLYKKQKHSSKVIGIDIKIKKNNKKRIESSPLMKNIVLFESSSVDVKCRDFLNKYIKKNDNVLLLLDSNHSEQHVFEELNLYTPFLKKGNYVVVFDTVIEEMPKNYYKNRNWNVGNNPLTALKKFLKTNKNFRTDDTIHEKILITNNRFGYIKKIK